MKALYLSCTAPFAEDSGAPVVRECELVQHLLGILGGTLHGTHARRLLAAVVLQKGVVECLHTAPTFYWLLLHVPPSGNTCE